MPGDETRIIKGIYSGGEHPTPVPFQVDADGSGSVTVPLPTVIHAGQNTVAVAGTQEPLAGNQAIYSGVRIKALAGNAGDIYVGDLNVDATHGFVLDAGEEVFVEIDNLMRVWIDSSANGDGVCFIAT